MSWQPQQIAPGYESGSGISRMMRRIEGMFDRHLAGEHGGDRVVRNEKTKVVPMNRMPREGELEKLYRQAHDEQRTFFDVATAVGVAPRRLYDWARTRGLPKPTHRKRRTIFNKKERKVIEL
jgi:hypothetical protein